MAENSLEIEAKFAVADFDDVRRRLRDAGATYVSRALETNRFFDRPDASLRNSGRGLRVRALNVLDGPPKAASITFKGPIQSGAFKTRRECEIEVSDAGRAAELLTALGFSETFSFEKCRESWQAGDCSIELDGLPYIGKFVEIEGPSDAAIQELRGQFGLAQADSIKASYLALLVRHCEANAIRTNHIRFTPPRA